MDSAGKRAQITLLLCMFAYHLHSDRIDNRERFLMVHDMNDSKSFIHSQGHIQ